MTFILTILFTSLIGISQIFLFGKAIFKQIFIPFFILLIADYVLLYGKYVIGDSFLTFVLYLPATILILFSIVWFIRIRKMRTNRNDERRYKITIKFCFLITAVVLLAPSFNNEDRYKIYHNDYNEVSEAFFSAYDDGKLSVGTDYSINDLKQLNAVFSDEVINTMEKLNRSAGIITYIVADKDVIYFSFGAIFQSISGIAICRNSKDPTTDIALKSRFFDGVTSYKYISKGAYLFSDGL